MDNSTISNIQQGIDSIIGIYDSDMAYIITAESDETLCQHTLYSLRTDNTKTDRIYRYIICNSNAYINDAKSFVNSIYGIANSRNNAYKLLNELKHKAFNKSINFHIYQVQ